MQDSFQTLKAQVYQTLRREILSGTTPPGTRLVRRTLSLRLGVSPIPVIEALHQLEKDGLVESQPMYGHRVRALSVDAARNDHVLREAIECQAARLCAQNASDKQLETLERQAVELDKILKGDPEGATPAEEHLEFHLGVARATGYSGLVDALQNLWFRRLMVFNTVNAAALGIPRNWHGQLVKALATRDPDVAERAMREHVQFNVAQQMKMLESSRVTEPVKDTASPSKNGSKKSVRKTSKV
ncbi:MAG TPA: GntR family transcriptional regulator [Verrucomicrobiae bacterium]|nr:GntR family transcriptional regulator [Verrucomicrobiae bacterium]